LSPRRSAAFLCSLYLTTVLISPEGKSLLLWVP
jgi:hypothetical protein